MGIDFSKCSVFFAFRIKVYMNQSLYHTVTHACMASVGGQYMCGLRIPIKSLALCYILVLLDRE